MYIWKRYSNRMYKRERRRRWRVTLKIRLSLNEVFNEWRIEAGIKAIIRLLRIIKEFENKRLVDTIWSI